MCRYVEQDASLNCAEMIDQLIAVNICLGKSIPNVCVQSFLEVTGIFLVCSNDFSLKVSHESFLDECKIFPPPRIFLEHS